MLTQFLWSLIRFPLMAWRFVQLAWPVLQVVMAVSGFLMGLAGLLALVYDYRPQALIASGTPLDDTQPMTMQFSLVNSGKLPIKNIRFQCDLNQIKTSTYVEVSNFTVFGPDSSRIRALVPGEQATVTCALENAFEFPSGTSIVDADVSIVAKFESQGLPWAGSCVFRFVTKRKADNKLYWFPEALITNPVEQMDDPRRTH